MQNTSQMREKDGEETGRMTQNVLVECQYN